MKRVSFFPSGIQPGKALTIAVPGLNMKPAAFFCPGRVHYDKMVLLAPANAIRRRSHLIKFFFLLGRKFGIPSRQPKEYRSQDKTPVQAYRVLFEMKKSIENQNYLNLTIPTLVFIDENDELISPGNLKKIMNKYQLTHWDVCTLNSQYVGKKTRYHHLIIDENTMGTENWHGFQSRIKAFFSL